MQTQHNLCWSHLSAALIQLELILFNWSLCWKMSVCRSWGSLLTSQHHANSDGDGFNGTWVKQVWRRSLLKAYSRPPAGCLWSPVLVLFLHSSEVSLLLLWTRSCVLRTWIKTLKFKMIHSFPHNSYPPPPSFRDELDISIHVLTHSLNMQIRAAPILLQRGAYYTNLDCTRLQLQYVWANE